MSAPFIPIPQSSPVSGRAHDFLDEFNRVAADPELGVSIQQLEEGLRATELVAESADTLNEMDLVARLFNDGQGVWNELLQNDFCQNYMKEKPAGDEETLEGFKWYMRQDFLYIVKQCQYEADRGLRATNTADFETSMGRVGRRAGYGKDLLKTCTTAPPDGLGIQDSVVLATPATDALERYIAFLIDAANSQNWVMSLVAMIPCIQSYYLIAVDLEENSQHTDTPWYKLWVKENVDGGPAQRQRQFFIDNYDQWKNDYPKAKEIFEKGIQAEIDLWGTALSPGS